MLATLGLHSCGGATTFPAPGGSHAMLTMMMDLMISFWQQ
jgi:hypothetical protein